MNGIKVLIKDVTKMYHQELGENNWDLQGTAPEQGELKG